MILHSQLILKINKKKINIKNKRRKKNQKINIHQIKINKLTFIGLKKKSNNILNFLKNMEEILKKFKKKQEQKVYNNVEIFL